MKKILLVSFFSAILIVFQLSVHQEKAEASKNANKVITIRMTGHMPVGQYDTISSIKFQKLVEEKSHGTIKFIYYPAGQLAKDMKAYDLCKAGGIEMAEFFTNRAIGQIPAVALGEVPNFDSADVGARLNYDIRDGGGFWFKYIKPGFVKQGLYIMPGFMYSPEHSTITEKPVHKMSDYKGLKIRVSGQALGFAVQSWGAVPTVMSSTDVYTALQRGTIDGVNSGLTSFVSRKWYEVANHVQSLHELFSILDVIVNLKFWNSLTAEQQNIIKDSLKAADIYSYEQAIADVAKNEKFLKSKGLEFVDFARDYPNELAKMEKATSIEMTKEVGKVVGEKVWADYTKMREKMKKDGPTWRQVLQAAEF